MQERLVLARYRPTARQALGRGLYLGGFGALALGATGVLLRICHADGVAADRGPVRWLLSLVAAALLATLLGGVAGLVVYRRCGAEADDRGVRRLHASAPGHESWRDVVDLRAERHGARIEVRAYLDNGGWVRLPAPYDGRLLAHDPGFEHKYLTLRQVWETHRSWNRSRSG
jgi:hypothetical protein